MIAGAGRIFAAAAVCLFAAGLRGDVQDVAAPTLSPVRTFFTVRSAKLDPSLGDGPRKSFEDDDGGPLKSVPVDLNGDGRPEKFVLGAAPSESGGSQWLVWDAAAGAGRGLVVGAIVFIERAADQGYARLETYWKQGADMAIVFRYRFANGQYTRVGSQSLTVPEIDEYFRRKPALDLDRELLEIRDGAPAEAPAAIRGGGR
jgi:hypothetical protein